MRSHFRLWCVFCLSFALLSIHTAGLPIVAAHMLAEPNINVTQDSTGTIPSGTVFYVAGNSSETGQLQNLGSVPLTVTYSSMYPLFGDAIRLDPDPLVAENANDDSGTIPAGSSIPFTVYCDSGSSTTESDGEVVIDSDDPDQSRYVFLIRCNANSGTETSEINIQQSGRDRPTGSTLYFQVGQTVRLTAQNLGENTLFMRRPSFASDDYFETGSNIFNQTNIPIDIPGLPKAQILIGAGEEPYFDIRCKNYVTDEESTTLIIPNSDPDDSENPYTLNLICSTQAPEIDVADSSGPIADGAASYTLVRGQSETFTVTNNGNWPLFLGAIDYDPEVAGFIVTDDFDQIDLPAGQSASVTIQCDPALANEISADALIVNDDPDEAPFNIHLTCSPPDIAISADGEDLVDGDSEVIFSPRSTKTFTVSNQGHKEALTLGALTLSDNDSGFAIIQPLSDADMTLGPGETDTFAVHCSSVSSEQSVTVHLSSNDPDESPFDLVLRCGHDAHRHKGTDQTTSGPSLLCGSDPRVTATTSSGVPVYCRFLVENGQFVSPVAEIGNAEMLAMSLTQVVDVFDLVGNTSGPIQVCVQGSGRLVFLDATEQPRTLHALDSVAQGASTCATLPHPGIVALVGGVVSAPAPAQPASDSTTLNSCMVTTRARVNLRSAPELGDNVIALVPYGVTLTATRHQGDWFYVDNMGVPGWISASVLTPSEGCG